MDCNICLASGDHFRSLVQTHAKAHHLALHQKDDNKENRHTPKHTTWHCNRRMRSKRTGKIMQAVELCASANN